MPLGPDTFMVDEPPIVRGSTLSPAGGATAQSQYGIRNRLAASPTRSRSSGGHKEAMYWTMLYNVCFCMIDSQ